MMKQQQKIEVDFKEKNKSIQKENQTKFSKFQEQFHENYIEEKMNMISRKAENIKKIHSGWAIGQKDEIYYDLIWIRNMVNFFIKEYENEEYENDSKENK